MEQKYNALKRLKNALGAAAAAAVAAAVTAAVAVASDRCDVATVFLVVLLGTGDDIEDGGVIQEIRSAERPDGTPLFNAPTSAALLVFFVLAMQCLPTLAVTRREAGSWKWAGLQFVWMSALAYVLAAITYAVVGALA